MKTLRGRCQNPTIARRLMTASGPINPLANEVSVGADNHEMVHKASDKDAAMAPDVDRGAVKHGVDCGDSIASARKEPRRG